MLLEPFPEDKDPLATAIFAVGALLALKGLGETSETRG
jgi:hypothetical protein